jgi:hypothetical protein
MLICYILGIPNLKNNKSVSYLDTLLKSETDDNLTRLYDKLDDFKFFIVDFPYLRSNIP